MRASCYRLNKNETIDSWMGVLAKKLDAEAGDDGPRFKFVKHNVSYMNGYITVESVSGKNTATINAKTPRHRLYGDIAGVNIEHSGPWQMEPRRINRRFKVGEDGSVNVKGIVKLIRERMEHADRTRARISEEERQEKAAVKDLVAAAKSLGLKAKAFSDTTVEITDNNGNQRTIYDVDANGEGTIRLRNLHVSKRNLVAALEILAAIDALPSAHGEDDD